MNKNDQVFYLDKIIEEVYSTLDQETLELIRNMNSGDVEVKQRINQAITPEIGERLQQIGLEPEFTEEQVGGFRMQSILGSALESGDPILVEAAQALIDEEDAAFNPANRQGGDVFAHAPKAEPLNDLVDQGERSFSDQDILNVLSAGPDDLSAALDQSMPSFFDRITATVEEEEKRHAPSQSPSLS